MVRRARLVASRFGLRAIGQVSELFKDDRGHIRLTLACLRKIVTLGRMEKESLSRNHFLMRSGIGAVIMGILLTGCSQGGTGTTDGHSPINGPKPVHTILPSPPIECNGIKPVPLIVKHEKLHS